jgi:hypothetical protein
MGSRWNGWRVSTLTAFNHHFKGKGPLVGVDMQYPPLILSSRE